jgi:Ala-tRNA(Pro) deacylase
LAGRTKGCLSYFLAVRRREFYASYPEEVPMSISIRLKELLDNSKVAYEHRTHPTAYTAAETAEASHIPGREMAKTVIVNADGLLRMAVLPANRMLDLDHLKFVTRSENIRLATEGEFKNAFPTCEIGAMPPFGNLFGVPVFCDTQLEQNESIEFNAGSHNDTIRMAFADFKRLASPTMIDLTDHHSTRVA